MTTNNRNVCLSALLAVLLSFPSFVSAFAPSRIPASFSAVVRPSSPFAGRRVVSLQSSSSDNDESAAEPAEGDEGSEADSSSSSVAEDEFQSAAAEWAAQQTKEIAAMTKKKYVVVGAGWGGWGAAKALCESGIDCDVTLIDALPDPTGVSSFVLCCRVSFACMYYQ